MTQFSLGDVEHLLRRFLADRPGFAEVTFSIDTDDDRLSMELFVNVGDGNDVRTCKILDYPPVKDPADETGEHRAACWDWTGKLIERVARELAGGEAKESP